MIMKIEHFYRQLIDEPLKTDFNPYTLDRVDIDSENKELQCLVFSPDPLTGNPVSDVAFMFSGADEGFKQFIKEKLFNAVPSSPLSEDSDEAVALVKRNLVTPEQYYRYAKEYVTNQLKND